MFLSEGQDGLDFFHNPTYGDLGIVVTDLAGTYLTTIDSGDGVEGARAALGVEHREEGVGCSTARQRRSMAIPIDVPEQAGKSTCGTQ